MSEYKTDLTKIYKFITKLDKVGTKNIWTEIDDFQSLHNHNCIDLSQVL